MGWNDRRQAKSKVEQVQGLRRSGASGSHGDRRTKRLRTRSSQKQQAIREQQ